MGQRLSRKERSEGGGECVHGVNPCTPLTPTDHKAKQHPRPDETPVGTGEGGGRERKERGGEHTKKKRQKKRRFRKFASFFSCLSRPTEAQGEQVEQGEVDQDTDEPPSRRCTDDQASLQDVICTVEDNDHQEPPSSSPEVSPAAEDQRVEDVQPQDQDSPASLSVGESPPHLLRQLDCDEIMRIENHICWKYTIGKKMGEGGFGSVFEGVRCKDGLVVAVKFTAKTENEPYVSLPDHPRPVPLEVALTVLANQGPSCPHIIKLIDWQDHPNQTIMVLERPIPCMDMHSFWEHHGGLFSEELARHFMQQVIDAAAVCCSRGVFHRDIKMPNLLVNTETLEVKLIDFGCGDLLRSSSYLTYSGTARYCPPEYFTKGEYHAKQATVWSLGVLLFAMITSLYPDSSDINLMDADIWFQPGFSDGRPVGHGEEGQPCVWRADMAWVAPPSLQPLRLAGLAWVAPLSLRPLRLAGLAWVAPLSLRPLRLAGLAWVAPLSLRPLRLAGLAWVAPPSLRPLRLAGLAWVAPPSLRPLRLAGLGAGMGGPSIPPAFASCGAGMGGPSIPPALASCRAGRPWLRLAPWLLRIHSSVSLQPQLQSFPEVPDMTHRVTLMPVMFASKIHAKTGKQRWPPTVSCHSLSQSWCLRLQSQSSSLNIPGHRGSC
ncbi:Serine/threonine-protein kinase pim-2 [Anabarilius grahami]|uniref:non-specific serine/threonine protein kinase n=1 Tax=Anabarilius grahami TaxID=495550 RepID=A0A3N0YPE4_ANAGA|nr:Serine/threonine-protein kinase pim-2 [Anabarilius grahami]